jgi:hypothetical protein
VRKDVSGNTTTYSEVQILRLIHFNSLLGLNGVQAEKSVALIEACGFNHQKFYLCNEMSEACSGGPNGFSIRNPIA